MIKILSNLKINEENACGDIIINNDEIYVSYFNESITLHNLESYNTYYIVQIGEANKKTHNYNFNERVIDFSFIKEDNSSTLYVLSRKILKMYKHFNIIEYGKLYEMSRPFIEIHTGIINHEENIYDICIVIKSNNSFNVNSPKNDLDIQQELEEIINPRNDIWDSYSLTINENEYKNITYVNLYDEISIDDSKEYIDIVINKYDYSFTARKDHSYDNETILISTNAGMLNTNTTTLENGSSVVRFYPMGYKGIFEIVLSYHKFDILNAYKFKII